MMSTWTLVVRAAAPTLLASWPALAQIADVPRIGFVQDQVTRRVHSILGVPGAAHVGPALELGESATPQAVAPRGDYVFVLAGEERRPALWVSQHGLLPLEGAVSGPDRVALSPEGVAAALYYRRENIVRTLSGLPDVPAPAGVFHLNASDAPLQDIAVSDDGKLVLVTRFEAGQTAASVISAAGELNQVRLSSPVSAIALASRSHDAVVAGNSEAVFVQGSERPAEIIQLPAAGLGAIESAAITPDGKQVLLATSEMAKVAIITLDGPTASLSAIPCDCAPTALARTGSGVRYRLTDYSGGVSWILDVSSSPARIFAVPSVNPEQLP